MEPEIVENADQFTIYTKNCVVCYDEATSFTGHVKGYDGDIAIAGWCNKPECRRDLSPSYGYVGPWLRLMGLQTSEDRK